MTTATDVSTNEVSATPWWLVLIEGIALIILGILFYVIVLPVGLLMRLFGKDPMARKFDSHTDTYRVKSTDQAKNHMEKPY